MKEIPLTNYDAFAKVDDEDYEYLSQWKWCGTDPGPYNKGAYAQRTTNQISMHRLLMGGKNIKKGLYVDHINNDTLDNRKANLRLVTASENQLNLKKFKNL